MKYCDYFISLLLSHHPQSLLMSCSPTEPYPSLCRIFGMTCHLNSALFFTSTTIPNHKTSSSSDSSIYHKAGEEVSIVTNWEVERVGSRAYVPRNIRREIKFLLSLTGRLKGW